MARATIVQRAMLLPQKCALCSADDRGREYVDLDLSIDKYGRVYLCSVCIKEIAELSGYVSARELSVAKKKVEIYRDKLMLAVARIGELENVVDSLRRIDSRDSGSSIASSVADEGRTKGKGLFDSELVESNTGSRSSSVSKAPRLFKDFEK